MTNSQGFAAPHIFEDEHQGGTLYHEGEEHEEEEWRFASSPGDGGDFVVEARRRCDSDLLKTRRLVLPILAMPKSPKDGAEQLLDLPSPAVSF